MTTATPTEPMRASLVRTFGRHLGQGVDLRRVNISDVCEEPGLENVPLAEFLTTHRAEQVDTIVATHVLARVLPLVDVMRAFHRALKPGGHLCIVVPYGSADAALADPRNVRVFTQLSWVFFDGTAPGLTDLKFEEVHMNLVPYPDLQLGADGVVGRGMELEVKTRFMRNVIAEMHVVLRKVGVDG